MMDFCEVVMGKLRRMSGRALIASVLCHLCMINSGGVSAAGSASAPQILEWQALVPPNWEPPMIAPAYDGTSDRLVDNRSLVHGLDGRPLKLPGFLRPVVYSDGSVTEFLLVPFLPHHIKQHAHLEPNQMVYVVLDRPVEIGNPFEPVWVTGTIRLQTVVTDEGPAGYKITEAEIQKYDY